MKKFIIPALAILILISGFVFMLLPFIPLGWLFVGIGSLLLTPYLKFMRKFIRWLAGKDRTGILEKAGKKAAKLYQWVGDHKRARKLKAIVQDACTTPRSAKSDLQ